MRSQSSMTAKPRGLWGHKLRQRWSWLRVYGHVWLHSAVGLPFRGILRQVLPHQVFDCTPPVYIMATKDDLDVNWDLLEAFAMLQQKSPTWWRRMPQLLKSILVIDRSGPTCFFLAERCCAINPWILRRKITVRSDAAIIMAGFLIHALCDALILTSPRGNVGISHRG